MPRRRGPAACASEQEAAADAAVRSGTKFHSAATNRIPSGRKVLQVQVDLADDAGAQRIGGGCPQRCLGAKPLSATGGEKIGKSSTQNHPLGVANLAAKP
jgi:hypothetical protein